MLAETHRGEVAGAAGRIILHPDVHEAFQKRAGREDDGRRLEDLAYLRLDAAHDAVLNDQALDARLAHLQVGGALEHALTARAVGGLVGLRAAGANGRALARIQKSKLDSSLVGRQAHLAAKGVDLADQVTLADAADGRVAGHLADVIEVESEHQRARAHPGRRERGFDSGVAGADNDDVVVHGEQRLWPARALRAKRGADTVDRRKVGKLYNKICSETRGGFHASFGRGDPCTRYQAQSCAQRTTLLSVAIKYECSARFKIPLRRVPAAADPSDASGRRASTARPRCVCIGGLPATRSPGGTTGRRGIP